MPGQAPASLDSPEPVFIERVASTLEVVRRNCNSFRRLTLYGSDGQPRHFLIQAQQQRVEGGGGVGSAKEKDRGNGGAVFVWWCAAG